jgi:cell division septal protein FtsQ
MIRATAGLFAVAFGIAVYATSLQVRGFLYESDFFRIQSDQIRIDAASDALRDDALKSLQGLLPVYRDNLLALDIAEVERELADLPRARAAKVEKHYPHGLSIRFTEREPMILANLDRPYFMDVDGVLLDEADPATIRASGLCVVTGLRAENCRQGDRLEQPRLGEVLRAVEFIRRHDSPVDRAIAEWNIDGMAEVTAILHGGAPVRFGTQSPLALLEKFSAATAKKPDLLANAAHIDLRMERQVVYNMRGPR